jgi:glycosyltransferase involved in cell wall biosynthesis
MKVILTLLCRDEDDILESVLRFHLANGIDHVIATDNGSTDRSLSILQRFERLGKLQLIQEKEHNHDQAVWVTRMARLAAEQGADWVINSDADEFWWPTNGTLKTMLEQIPLHIKACNVERTNFLPPPRNTSTRRAFYIRQNLRERVSYNSLGKPLPPKVIHRGERKITLSDGNHSAYLEGQLLETIPCQGINILHYPIRSYTQLERKIRQGTEALERNTRVDPGVGNAWRKIYHDHLADGNLKDYYDGLRPSDREITKMLDKGELIHDKRLLRALRRSPSWLPW